MQAVLFVYQDIGHSSGGSKFCGIGLRGQLIFTILKESTKFNFVPCACNSIDTVDEYVRIHNPNAIIYNYHPITTPWIAAANVVTRYPKIRHFRIHYDLTQEEANGAPAVGNYVITDNEFIRSNDRVFVVPRATPTPKDNVEPKPEDIPAIGYHGFLFERKGVVEIAKAVAKEFDTAVLRIHAPESHFCSENTNAIMERVRSAVIGKDIRIEFTTHFMNDTEIVEWLSQNTLNCYFYHEIPGSGIASSPDYAIAARRPIAVVRSNMLFNLWKNVPSCLYEGENTLKRIIEAGTAPLIPLYEQYSHARMRAAYEDMLMKTRKCVLYVGQTIGFRKGEPNFCGIGLRGKLTTEILADSSRYEFIPCFCDSFDTVDKYVAEHSPVAIIFNFHPSTSPWMSQNPKDRYPTIPTVLINVDMTQAMADDFGRNPVNSDYMLCDDETRIGNSRVFVMPRSTPRPVASPPDPEIPTIGFQGFPAPHKGIHELAHRVRNEFDTAIIRLHMPASHFGDPDGSAARRWAEDVRSIVAGTNIQVEASHDFKSDEEIVEWLSRNSVNCYFYNNDWPNAGPASSPDYALAARRPIAVRNTVMMTNITRHTTLATIETSSLREIIARGIEHLKPIYAHHSREAVVKAYEDMCDAIVCTKSPVPEPVAPRPRSVPVQDFSRSVLSILNRQTA